MMLGKRGRPPMKRTTSMTQFILGGVDPNNPCHGGRYSAAASPGPQRRVSADFVETAHFLRVCSLCQNRLIPGHDIFMYRGDSAFCSLECRQQQMSQDERKEKCSTASKKEVGGAAVGAQVSASGETVPAL